MTHTFTTKGRTRYRYYACTAAIKRGRKTCPSGSLPAAQIEAAVVEEVRGVARDPALREEVLRQALAHQEAAVAALRRQRADLERELGRYRAELRALATGENRDAAARIADLHEHVARAERRAEELRERLACAERERIGAEDVEAAFGRFDALWGELSPREQARALALLVGRVEFDAADRSIAVTFHPTELRTLGEAEPGEAA